MAMMKLKAFRADKVTSREELVKAFYAELECDPDLWADLERPAQGEHEVLEW